MGAIASRLVVDLSADTWYMNKSQAKEYALSVSLDGLDDRAGDKISWCPKDAIERGEVTQLDFDQYWEVKKTGGYATLCNRVKDRQSKATSRMVSSCAGNCQVVVQSGGTSCPTTITAPRAGRGLPPALQRLQQCSDAGRRRESRGRCGPWCVSWQSTPWTGAGPSSGLSRENVKI